MYSPTLQYQLIQTHIEDRSRQASENALRSALSQHRGRSGDAIAGASDAGPARGSSFRFARHYAEMVGVMFAGMYALMGAPTNWLFSALGTSWSRLSPAMYTFAMALTMTLPMVVWMRYRGHAWRANIEMAASMLIPTFIVMVALWAGAANDLALPEHAGMLACMLVAMLLRRDEYSCAAHAPRRGRQAIVA